MHYILKNILRYSRFGLLTDSRNTANAKKDIYIGLQMDNFGTIKKIKSFADRFKVFIKFAMISWILIKRARDFIYKINNNVITEAYLGPCQASNNTKQYLLIEIVPYHQVPFHALKYGIFFSFF